MPNQNFTTRTIELLANLRETGQYKHLHHVMGPLGATATLEGVGEVIVLCSNNYLGLASHPEVIEAAHQGVRDYGAGTASVRVICGTLGCHRTTEKTIARFSGTEAALTYVSAWNANEAIIPTAADKEDVLISD